MFRAALSWLVLAPAIAGAGTLIGKLDLPPPPERPAVATRGFLDRSENPLAPVKPYSVTPELVVVLEGGETAMAAPQITWELVGESFARPVIAVPAGSEVVIKDTTKVARTLAAQEDKQLIPAGPINPGGTRSFRVTDAGRTYTIGDRDAPHLIGRVVVVASTLIGYPDETGRFEIADVPPGSYKLRVWYRDHWVARSDDTVTISAKGKTDFNPKLPADAFGPAKK